MTKEQPLKHVLQVRYDTETIQTLNTIAYLTGNCVSTVARNITKRELPNKGNENGKDTENNGSDTSG